MKFPSEWVVRWAWPIIVTFVIGSLLFLIPLRNIEIDPEIKNQLPPDMPARLHIHQIEQQFGGSELVMIVVEAPDVLAAPTLERVRKIGEALAKVPSIDRVISPFTLTDIRGTPDGMMDVEPAITEIPTDDAGRTALRERLRTNDLAFGNVLAKDFSAVAVIGMLSTEAKDSVTNAAVDELLAENPGPENVIVGGMPAVRQSVSDDIRTDIRRFGPFGVLLIIGFLYFTLREWRGVVVPFSVQIMSILVAMGLIPIFGWKVQMVTVVLPVILLAVGNDYGIHLIARFQEENLPGRTDSAADITKRVLSELGVPVLAAGATTAAGMLCLLTHLVVPARQLGILAGIGVTFAIVASLTFAPAIMAKLPKPKPVPGIGEENGRFLDRLLHMTARLVTGRRRVVIAACVLAAAIASAGIPLLKVDTNPVNYYEHDAPVAVSARTINEHFGGSTELSVLVEGDIRDPAVLKKIDALEAELLRNPSVGYTMSIARVIRKMNQAVHGGDPAESRIPDDRASIAQLLLLYGMGGSPDDFARMVDADYAHALVTARVSSLSTDEIAGVVTDIRQYTAREFVGIPVVIGGFGEVFAELVDAVVQGQVSSLALSFLVVGLLCALSFLSLEAGIYSMIPLMLAVPSLFGLMGYMGIELNVVTAMLSSIMIGVGVDYTIHFLWRYREERAHHPPEHAAFRALTTAGRGIVFNAFSVVFGFSILLLSTFLPIRFFGFLVVVSIGGCLIGALVLMPAVVVELRPRFTEPKLPPR